MTDMNAYTSRYTRQTMLDEIGLAGQHAISNAHVLIVGVGGLGSPVAMYLAGAGVGTIGIADNDVVSESNLHRQILYRQSQVGKPKVEMAAELLKALNPDVIIEPYRCMLDAANASELLVQYDLVIDCCDNFSTRYLIDNVCADLKKTWIYGSIGRFCGQVSVFTPSSPCRYSDLYPERQRLCSQPKRTEGVIGPVPGVIGSIQACEALKILAGVPDTLDGKLFTIDLKTMITNIIEL